MEWITHYVYAIWVMHETTANSAHKYLQYSGTSRWHNNFGLSVSHKNKGHISVENVGNWVINKWIIISA
jgi:hypothetical protein